MFGPSTTQLRPPNQSAKTDSANNNERPLSVYDNLTTAVPAHSADDDRDGDHHRSQPDRIPGSRSRFTFDALLLNAMPTTTTTTMTSPTSPTTTTTPHHNSRSNGKSAVVVTDIDVDPPRYTSSPATSTSQTPRQKRQHPQLHHHHQQQQHNHQHAQQPTGSTPVAVVAPLLSSSPPPPPASAEATGETSAPVPAAQYENVVETIKLRNSFRLQQSAANAAAAKPAISDAKSTFFGLPTASSATPATVAGSPQPPLYSMPHQQQQQQHQARLMSRSAAAAAADAQPQSDRSPLLDETAATALAAPLASKSNGEYQNIPSNSALFQQQRSATAGAVDAGSSSLDYSDLVHVASPALTADQAAANHIATAGGGGKHYMLEANRRISEQHTPSQAVYMSTTVPQNIKGSNIAGRHTPTRTSLRHSRMIVVNKNYQAPRRPNPLHLTHPLIAKLLLSVQLCCGLLISCLSVWVLLWAPNTRTRDNPYWSGLLLIVAAALALVLVQFRRQPRQKMREHCYTFLRLNSTTLSLLATVVAFAAFLFATLHLDNVTSAQTVCMPADVFSSSNAVCICLFGSSGVAAAANATAAVRPLDGGGLTADGLEFQYRDLSCTEVRGAWKYILFAFTLLNMIAFIVSFLYLMMVCCPRRGHKQRPRRPSDARTGTNGNGSAAAASAYAPVRSAL